MARNGAEWRGILYNCDRTSELTESAHNPRHFRAESAKLDAAHCGTLPDARPGPVELKLASLGPVQPLVVGHYGEMGGYVDELLELAADAGADKHW